MKKITIAFFGVLLFIAGHKYTRRQAAYMATKNWVVPSAYTTPPITYPLKTLPVFAFRLDKSF